jgi:hypothetical protein
MPLRLGCRMPELFGKTVACLKISQCVFVDSTDHSNSKLIFRVFGRLVHQTCLCTCVLLRMKILISCYSAHTLFVCLFILDLLACM